MPITKPTIAAAARSARPATRRARSSLRRASSAAPLIGSTSATVTSTPAPAPGPRWTLDTLHDPKNANRYLYAGDDPSNNIDPSGRISGSDLGAALGGFAGNRVGAGLGLGVAAGCAVATSETGPGVVFCAFGIPISKAFFTRAGAYYGTLAGGGSETEARDNFVIGAVAGGFV